MSIWTSKVCCWRGVNVYFTTGLPQNIAVHNKVIVHHRPTTKYSCSQQGYSSPPAYHKI